MNKKLILSLLGLSIFSIINNNLTLYPEASNISKVQEDLAPLITYTTEKIGDREKMKVTVSVEDRSGSGIKEFRDHKGNIINTNSIDVVFSRREPSTFLAIDNDNNKSELTIDLTWINPLTGSVKNTLKTGSAYWVSSNLREWLNSDSDVVSYTCNAPTNENTDGKGYSEESGFLHSFTEEEKNAIATTKRKVILHSVYNELVENGVATVGHAKNIGNASIMGSYGNHFIQNYSNMKSMTINDKVFLLNQTEVMWYLYRRGDSFFRESINSANYKYMDRSWWVQAHDEYMGTEILYSVNDRKFYQNHNALYKRGVVPAINIKPDYIFKNGIKANELNISDTIEFGQYKGNPILWKVINISEDGYPLLLSEKILDFKIFDAKGDYPRRYSDYINFDNYDISMIDINYRNISGTPDIEPPLISPIDDTPLKNRQNSAFEVDFQVIDDSNIKYIKLPNNTIITDKTFTYLFESNDVYTFEVCDIYGNFNEYSVPIGNINDKPILTIESSSDEDWSNNVEIEIRSSNAVKKTINQILKQNGLSMDKFPNYISYNNASFNISGKVKLKKYSENAINESFFIGFLYENKYENKYSYGLNTVGYTKYPIYINDLINSENNEFEFNIEQTIPGDYFRNLQIYIPTSVETLNNATFEVEIECTYEIVDDSDFAIKNIILPNGEKINDVKKYTDVITEEGIHHLTYKVEDNRGITTEKTITVKVDKTAPTLDLNYNTNVTNQNISVNTNASDATSGVKRIKLPNGNYITNLNSTYTISGDGEYRFECEDVAGNITTKTITINNIDKEKPNVVIDKDKTNWTNKGVQININARD